MLLSAEAALHVSRAWLLATFGLGLGCILLTWLLTRGALTKSALQSVLRRPAILVPAAMTTAGIWILMTWVFDPTLHENPFGLEFARGLGRGRRANWLVLALVAGGLAGQIGLLEAVERGRRCDGFAMLQGIRNHFATFFLAKVGIAGGAWLVSAVVPPRDPLLIAYVVPSLFLAPVAGTATRHPGRPLPALRDALAMASRDMFAVGWPVLAQTMLLLGIAFLVGRLASSPIPPELLTFSSSAVSFNHAPFLLVQAPAIAATIATAASVFGSAVFVTVHWEGGHRGYRAVRRELRGCATC